MKITFVKPVVHQNGGSRVVAIYAEKLLSLGHEVTVVARAPVPQTARSIVKSLLNGRVPRRPDPARTQFFDPIGSRYREVLRDGPLLPEDLPDADVVIATFWKTAFEVATMPPEKGAKFYFVQGHEVFPGQSWALSNGSYYLPLQKITISSHLQNIMSEFYGDNDVPIVENSVDIEQFHAPPRQKNSRPTVGLLYAPTPVKGLDVSIDAIRIARKTFPDLRVVAFGVGPLDPDFQLPPDSVYRQRPKQNEIRELYEKCDVWLCGSRSEGFHLPPLEAMACRCPVVMTRVGGAVEIVSENVNGHIVDIEDAEALGARLVDVLSLSPEDWLVMSDAAHARAQSYSWDDAAKAFETVLRDLLNAQS